MYGLLYKDTIVLRKNFLPTMLGVGFMQFLHFVGVMGEPDVDIKSIYKLMSLFAILCTFYIMGMFEQGIFDPDERKKWAYYVTSTEGGVKAQVGEKYILMYLLSMGTMVFCNTMNAIAIDVTKDKAVSMMGISIALFFIQMFLRAIDIPFMIAFGSKKGNMLHGAMLVAGLFIVAAYLLFGDLSFFGNSMDGFWDRIFELMSVGNNVKVLIVLLICALAVLPLYYLSYCISCKYYLKGVDGYDK